MLGAPEVVLIFGFVFQAADGNNIYSILAEICPTTDFLKTRRQDGAFILKVGWVIRLHSLARMGVSRNDACGSWREQCPLPP